jgi:hypothetical protein
MGSSLMPVSMGLQPGIANFFPRNIDGQILQDAHDRRKIVGEFFYKFVRPQVRCLC